MADRSDLLHPRGAGWRRQRHPGFVVHADVPGDTHLAFAAAVARGLEERPRRLEPRFIYDALGSEIYEEITAQPEYYPTRTEDRILAAHAESIATLVGGTTLVELGSGSSTKTRHLLDAWRSHPPVSYIPIDVSASAVVGACSDLRGRYPDLHVEGVASTFQRGMDLVRTIEPKTLVFLGSTLGNFKPDEVDAFFYQVSQILSPGDHMLLGIDRVKPEAILEAAYDDDAGATERFILNVFARMNRELSAGVDIDAFSMRSFYDIERQRIEMWAEVQRSQTLHVTPLGRSFRLVGGERILVEVSRKFTVAQIQREASRFDLVLREAFEDDDRHFAVLLLQRAERSVTWSPTTASTTPAPRRPEAVSVGGWRLVPAGPAFLGEPTAQREVAAVSLWATPATNEAFATFVAAGGYRDGANWSEAGAAWLATAEVDAPLGWERVSDRWRRLGVPLDPMAAVSGINYFEAEAFAAWSGARLPTEAEWEKAAAWDPEHGRSRTWPWGERPPDPRRVNGGGGLHGPVAVGSYPRSVSFYGLHQVLGDVWEWVQGEEGPVLRGGSFQTALAELNCHLRRSASAVHRSVAVGARLAQDP